MPWTKDTSSRSPKTLYVAPESAHPMKAVVYDPNAENPWCVEYAWLNNDADTQGTVETLMGL
ncbi:hypothetical protein [Nocardioides sp.]|uniref:hypothetical protein n=1 Tax=Nocardioides sp. TaxID=35761 RepID=UPI00356A0991